MTLIQILVTYLLFSLLIFMVCIWDCWRRGLVTLGDLLGSLFVSIIPGCNLIILVELGTYLLNRFNGIILWRKKKSPTK